MLLLDDFDVEPDLQYHVRLRGDTIHRLPAVMTVSKLFLRRSFLMSVALRSCGVFFMANAWTQQSSLTPRHPLPFIHKATTIKRYSPLFVSKDASNIGESEDADDDDDSEGLDWFDGHAELVADDDGNDDDDTDWIPDREQARRRKTQYQTATPASPTPQQEGTGASSSPQPQQGSMYTEEEEELISAMGGKFKDSPKSKREDGFLGDSTLQEIATDYSVPVCYLADVLCMWGVPVPINIHDRLGDLVTGEQAFAIVEAIYSLDISALHDRYSNQSLLSICDDYDIDLKDAFQMAMKEGWSLPFGVQTCLRVEQEEELIRVFGSI